ncbi:MmgE/PrpD family protein [Bosea sp. (in: a-proteobacteria)]|uniref:MmgE/PrpD family protein n=1 Tax=Bosea sp. (in: a-proteobacteria) TaxID=1871050 RepID=UPI0026287426|nr:MmgE/PrpD family protein [Bosea sp. (in: a-proteobacteria)]MCO5089574.1 MmgE/PrpD family protein [Bosea sp. (in: a-proteobacteria)]
MNIQAQTEPSGAARTVKPPAVSHQLAAFAAGLTYDALPASTVGATKRLLLDGIGCLLHGTRGEPGQIAWQSITRLRHGSGEGPATAVIGGKRISVHDAAFVNGITLYSVGVNDIHKDSYSHPGGCVVPVILAVGEWLDAPGTDMLPAMAAGYDVMGRLGRAVGEAHWARGFHPTGTLGPFGATAAAGRLLGLDAATMNSALGIAGSQSSGLKAFQSDGSLTMIFHAGRSAQNGVEAAVLAQQGFVGPGAVIEDPQGFVAVTAGGSPLDPVTQALGQSFEVERTSFRPFYGCTLTITSSGATAEIMRRNPGRAGEVAEIEVRCHPHIIDDVGNDDPRTQLAARLSLEYNVALVVHRGDVVVADITEQDLWEPGIRNLLPLIRLTPDPTMPHWASKIRIRFKDGHEDRAEMFSPKGDPENPLSWDDIVEKFMRIVEPLGRPAEARIVADMVGDLERHRGAELVAAINAVARPRQ